MSNSLQILKPIEIFGFSPQSGASGQLFLVSGRNLIDVASVSFKDPFEKSIPVESFSTYFNGSDYGISGIIPNLHPSKGIYEIVVENETYNDSHCCFYTPMSGGLAEGVKNYYKQFSDRIFLNSIVQPTGVTNAQGFEVKNITFTPCRAESVVRIDCELNLYASSFAGAVICLYKNSETTPRRVWSQFLYDSSAGTVFKFTYTTSGTAVAPQTWRIRLGRTPDYAASIYLNRNVSYPTLYGTAAISSINITEFAT